MTQALHLVNYFYEFLRLNTEENLIDPATSDTELPAWVLRNETVHQHLSNLAITLKQAPEYAQSEQHAANPMHISSKTLTGATVLS